jgi:hypothetical protein
MNVNARAQAAHLLVQVEVNAFVPDIDGTGRNHQLDLKGFAVISTSFY